MSASPVPPAGHIPPAFLGVLVELDENITATLAAEKKAAKKMAANKAKAINSIRQTLKKKVKEFEPVLATYKESPSDYSAAYDKANVAPKPAKAATKKAVVDDEEGAADDLDFQAVGKGGKALNLTAEGTYKTLRDVFESRGKKNTDRAETIRILTKLLEVTETNYQKIRVLLALVPARLDYSQALPSIPHESWVLGMHELDQLISLLLEQPDYFVTENPGEYDDMVERTPETRDGKKVRVGIAGNLISLLENLDNEFTKTLQHTDAHEKGADYITRLREEAPLYALITKAQALFEREDRSDEVVRAVMRRVEHLYAKPDQVIEHFQQFALPRLSGLSSKISPFDSPLSPSTLMRLLCVTIYNSDAPLLRARAILCHIFNHATKGRYHQARDLLLMSHLQDSIAQADVTTQILYNRALMQLGLSAFRLGYITECQTVLAEMFSTQRQKELLAQAIQRYGNTITPEQELIEKRRLLPFHMHLNIELLEAAYLTSCMLIEVPLLAGAENEEQRRRIASKQFKRLLDAADKQAFMGPPENTRDHIIKASKALSVGEWEKAVELIQSIKIWTLLDNVEDVKAILAKKIQEEGLRTYLFTYASHYASLSLSHLASTFDLSKSTVVSIIIRMIYSEEIAAALDQIDGVVLFHTVETTEVQRLALQLADRVANLVESNEKTLDQKLGNQTGPVGGGERGEGQQRGGPGRERRGGNRGARGGRGRGRGGFNSGLGTGRRVAA